MRLRISVPLILIAFSILLPPPQPTQAQTEVQFPDSNLEDAVRQAINVPSGPIFDSSLESLITLNAGNRGITDISGIEHCTNLAEVNLFNNQISDISPLSGLVGLVRLYLYTNEITDISPLLMMENLEQVFLNNNQIGDINPLVLNPGIGSGDTLQLSKNPLNCIAVHFQVPLLESRGVMIGSDAESPEVWRCLFELSASWYQGVPELKTQELFQLLEVEGN